MFLKAELSIYCLVHGLRGRSEDLERLGRLPSKVKVNMAIEMTDLCVSVCAEGIKARFPDISDEELTKKLRERLKWGKRWRRREG